MTLLQYVPIPTWRDFIDIVFLTLVTYHLYVWFRETRALRVLIGLVVLGGIYSIAKFWGLFLTTWVFQVLWQVLLILLLILFQSEIRQVLEKVSPLRYLRSLRYHPGESLIRDIVQVVFEMAREKTGVLIVITRNDNPSEFLHSGHNIMALPEPSLIKSIFNRYAPTHDGALVVSKDRLIQMGALLPLSEKKDIPDHFGTRHRAAIGLTERTDSICLVVSEERAEVATVVEGAIQIWADPESLTQQLIEWTTPQQVSRPVLAEFVQSAFTRNWKSKLSALLIVAVAWLVLAGQQINTINMYAQIHHANIPDGMLIGKTSVNTVRLTLSGNRNSISALKEQDVHVRVDMGAYARGEHLIKLSDKNVELPLGVKVDMVTPQQIKVVLEPEQKVVIP
jgi:uncharacterized protein (TIGR00159 family)